MNIMGQLVADRGSNMEGKSFGLIGLAWRLLHFCAGECNAVITRIITLSFII